MGTRSLLAVETKKSNLHVQYMQFDGYPSVKGYEYYTAVLYALMEAGCCNFVTKQGNPNQHFRDRCVHFLNNYQYKTHHSTGNNFKMKMGEWGFQTDSWQEFEYLFNYKGLFRMDGWGLTYEIPWEMTKGIAKAFSPTDFQDSNYGENSPDFFNMLFDQLDKEGTKHPATLELECGEVDAFTDSKGKAGWRDYGILKIRVGKKCVKTVKSMFADKKGKKKNVQKLKAFAERG
jgi:hypothetical protein